MFRLLLDLVLVFVFALLGRASHNENVFAGAFGTAWPFLVACLVGWGIVALLGDDGRGLRGWAIIWFLTVAGGQGLRVAAGGTTAVSFVIVTAVVLALLLGSWRVILWLRSRAARA